MNQHSYISDSIELLKSMIDIQSFSREEKDVADFIEQFLKIRGLSPRRKGNNIWVISKHYSQDKPTVLLNSHIDTVRPSSGWTYSPTRSTIESDRIYGLGSNDAGASVVSLLALFRILEEEEQPCNFIFSATAEEEISGDGGVASILDELSPVDLGVVGEPTRMQMAVAEKGLMVLDGEVMGKSGHAARNEGINAIYQALSVIDWFKNFEFSKKSDFLGDVKMTVTGIEAGSQHNVVPDSCKFMVDIRVNEHYQNRELFELIQQQVSCELTARSFRLNSSFIPVDHPLVKRGEELGLEKYGSPTTSDQARMPFPTIKIGPGDSARSHTPNEYIIVSEIIEGVQIYKGLLEGLHINSK
ncbi:M20 family metallo-hydrolase [Marinilabilia rubra]|uniref:Acetylornithine deacetylase n=1 Tax=Marinilabilia rubra TaxID=2162893 RepID=A0A2U2BDT3_9BACT|nr:M20 family metallo-hydrolase [Marinilabilia rubra]PWE01193.1 acetylornithine deacetylase [Marinilabilia rubra]